MRPGRRRQRAARAALRRTRRRAGRQCSRQRGGVFMRSPVEHGAGSPSSYRKAAAACAVRPRMLYSRAVHTHGLHRRHRPTRRGRRCPPGPGPPTRSRWPSAALGAARGGVRRVPPARGRRARLGHLGVAHPRWRRSSSCWCGTPSGAISRSSCRAWRSVARWWARGGRARGRAGVGRLAAGGAAGRVPGRRHVRLPRRRRALQAVQERVPQPAGPLRRGLVPRDRGGRVQVGPRGRGPAEHRVHAGAADADAVRRAPASAGIRSGPASSLVLVACLWGFVYVYRLARSALGDADRAACGRGAARGVPVRRVLQRGVHGVDLPALRGRRLLPRRRGASTCRTAAFALLCGFARPNGFLLAVPIALVALWPAIVGGLARRGRAASARGSSARVRASLPAIAAASAAVVGVLVFSAFIYSLTGRPFAWLEAHAAWGRTFGTWVSQGPFQELGRGGLYGYTRSQPIDAVNFVGRCSAPSRRSGRSRGASACPTACSSPST